MILLKMYNITRQEAADKLNMSTRSIDRYIKSGKFRIKKEGKIIYLHDDDVNVFLGGGQTNAKIIMPNEFKSQDNDSLMDTNIAKETGMMIKSDYDKITATFEKVFTNLREEINKKDEKIQELSIKLGRNEEIIKNSISISDYKKSQSLLEDSKNHLNQELNTNKNEKERLKIELKHEKFINNMLIAFALLIIIIVLSIWLFLN